jgi:hypothetical protein
VHPKCALPGDRETDHVCKDLTSDGEVAVLIADGTLSEYNGFDSKEMQPQQHTRVKAVAAVAAVVAAVGLAVVAAVGLAVVAAVVGSVGRLGGAVDGDAPKSFLCARSTGTSCSSLYGSMR